jgi:diacylglycerol kinase
MRGWDFRTHSLAESFRHAWEGLRYIYTTQRNMRIHVFIASLAMSASIILGLDRIEFLMVTLAVLGVLSAEVLNTLTESLVDLIEPEYSLVAKMVKDVAAAGVLLTAVFSVIIGAIAFYPALGNLPEILRDFTRYRWPNLLVQAVVFVLPSLWGMMKHETPGRS